MSTIEITKTIVFTTTDQAADDLEFHYNGSLTINVYFVGDPADSGKRVEVDVMTLSEPGEENALDAIRGYIEHVYETEEDF